MTDHPVKKVAAREDVCVAFKTTSRRRFGYIAIDEIGIGSGSDRRCDMAEGRLIVKPVSRVEETDELAGHQIKSLIHGVENAAVFLGDDSDSGVRWDRRKASWIGSTVLDDEFPVALTLAEHRCDSPEKFLDRRIQHDRDNGKSGTHDAIGSFRMSESGHGSGSAAVRNQIAADVLCCPMPRRIRLADGITVSRPC
jgi:hypothetical protein